MATFTIRRNHPYAGTVTLCKLAGGAFVPRTMEVTESAFLAAVLVYMKNMKPTEREKLAKEAPPAQVPPPGAGEQKPFKVRKAATAAVG
jgi:hypothetical protein